MPEQARWGELQEWVRGAAASETDECLIWPFLSVTGETPRPTMSHGSRTNVLVSHVILEMDGRPLSPGQQANHTCDESFCCNPRHLYAGDQQENARDAIRRGRRPGLSDEQIEEIHRLSATHNPRQIADKLGISFWAARYHYRLARKAA